MLQMPTKCERLWALSVRISQPCLIRPPLISHFCLVRHTPVDTFYWQPLVNGPLNSSPPEHTPLITNSAHFWVELDGVYCTVGSRFWVWDAKIITVTVSRHRPLRRKYQEIVKSVFLQTMGVMSGHARKKTHGELQDKINGLWVQYQTVRERNRILHRFVHISFVI